MMTAETLPQILTDLENDPETEFLTLDPKLIHANEISGDSNFNETLLHATVAKINKAHQPPIAIAQKKDVGSYELLTQRKWWQASLVLNRPMSVMVVGNLNRQQIGLTRLYDTWRDEDQPLFEVATLLAATISLGLTRVYIAKQISMSIAVQSELLSLLNAPGAIQTLAKQLPRNDLSSLSALRRLFQDDPATAQDLIATNALSRNLILNLRQTGKRRGESVSIPKNVGRYVVELFGKHYQLATDRKPIHGKAWLVDENGVYLSVDLGSVDLRVVGFEANG